MSVLPWMIMAAGCAAADYTNPISQPGAGESVQPPRHHFRIQFENDSAVGTDEKYTHGTRLDYMQGVSHPDAPVNIGCSLMQNIYTPELHSRHANPGEHPYAGLTALGGIVQIGGAGESLTAELQLGVMGKYSYAKECQNNLHSACGMETWKGWHDQVPSEAVLQLSMRGDKDLELQTPYADGLVFIREELGNARIAAGIGTAFRVGKNLPQTNQVVGNRAGNVCSSMIKREYDPAAPSYYLLAQAELDYVARDFSVDGGMFHHFEQTCSRVPWQGQFTIGAGVMHHGIDYFAGLVLNTESYRSEDNPQAYGTFSVQWNW